MATEDLRINYSQIARVKRAKMQQRQPSLDDRYYSVSINWDHMGKVLNAKAKHGEGTTSITGVVDIKPYTKQPRTTIQRIIDEIKYRFRMFRVRYGFGRNKFKRYTPEY